MPNLLRNLKLIELSLVDVPANPGAKVCLFKRADAFPNPLLKRDHAAPPNPLLKAGRHPFAEHEPEARGKPFGKPARSEREAAARFERKPKPSPAEQRTAARLEDEDDDDMVKNFDDAVESISNREGCSKTAALRKARERFPDLFKIYQAEAQALIAKAAPAPIEKSDSIKKFEGLIDKVQDRDGCSRLEALSRAAREYPTEREAYSTALS